MYIGEWGIEIEGIDGEATAMGEWLVFKDGQGAEIKIDPAVVQSLYGSYLKLKDELESE